MITKSPARRQGHPSSQFGEARNDVAGRRPENQIQIDLAQCRLHVPLVELGLADIPGLARWIVPEQPRRPAFAQREGERNGDIQTLQAWVDGRGMA